MPRKPIICSATQKGKRPKQEDTVLIWSRNGIYIQAVFDGHAGGEVSAALPGAFQTLGASLTSELFQHPVEFKKYIAANFVEIDEWLLRRFKKRAVDAGSTGCVSFYDANTMCMYLAWLGDSRGVVLEMSKNNPMNKTTKLTATVDHKPDNLQETARIERAGGHVETSGPTSSVYRVNGQLAMSRAFGDHSLKRYFNGGNDNWVSNVPDCIGPIKLSHPEKQYFVVLGSDGIFDMCSNVAIRNMVVRHAKDNDNNLNDLCKELVKTAIARWLNTQGGDNCTVVVAHFL